MELLHTERNRAYKVTKCLYLEFFGIFMITMYIRTYAVSLRLTADEIQ